MRKDSVFALYSAMCLFNTFLHLRTVILYTFTVMFNPKKLRHLLYLAIVVLLPFSAIAQRAAVKGTVLKSNSAERLAQVLITNQATKTARMSNGLGAFNIDAAPGDTLVFSKTGFELYRMVTPLSQEFTVYLWPVDGVQLNEVRVYGKSKKQEMNDVLNTYRSKGLYFDGKPPITTFLPFGGSPLTGLYELFGTDAKNLKRFVRFQKRELEASEVDKRYNKSFVMRITGIKTEEEAQKFMDYYRPSYEDIIKWNDYDLVLKTKRQFEYYQKNKDAIRNDNPFD